MKRILFASTSTNNVYTVIDSLRHLGTAEVEVFHYDRRWHEQCQMAIQSNPGVRELLQMGAWPPLEAREAWRQRVAMDEALLRRAQEWRPDAILYISAWEGLFVPENKTLVKLRDIAPLVHFCFDCSDPPWWPQMEQFEKDGCFDLTVNIDGGHQWPGGRKWRDLGMDFAIRGLTLLTPIDPNHFDGVQIAFHERPYPVGYAGNSGGWIRSALVQRLQNKLSCGLAHKPRDDNPASYRHYCDFLRHCRVSISIPFTGSNAAKHVKGRVVETGYAGACLLEWANDATASWFTPRADYWTYESVEECVEMAEWLAAHPKIAGEIARNLQSKVTTEHSPQVFWQRVFDALSDVRPRGDAGKIPEVKPSKRPSRVTRREA